MSTRKTDEVSALRRKTPVGEPHSVEHFIEILLVALDYAAGATDSALRKLWQVTIRDIETVLADDTAAVLPARDRLAHRTDPEGRRMYACICRLLRAHGDAECEAKEAIERARRS